LKIKVKQFEAFDNVQPLYKTKWILVAKLLFGRQNTIGTGLRLFLFW